MAYAFSLLTVIGLTKKYFIFRTSMIISILYYKNAWSGFKARRAVPINRKQKVD